MLCILILLIYIIKYCNAEINSGTKGLLLNISRSRPPNINVVRQNYYKIDTLVYTAVNGYINEVVDDKGNIWKVQNLDVKFTKVTKFRNESRLLHIYVLYNNGNSSISYYYRTGRVWNEVSENLFYNEFDAYRTLTYNIGDFTLYLNRKNNTKKVRFNLQDKSTYAAYAPNYGYQITKVCDVSWWLFCFKSVWVPKDNEHCLFSSVHNKNKPDLVYLIISDKDKIVERFYNKSKGLFKKWNEINKSDYIDKLKSRGFDPDKFDNTVELNLDNVDIKKFYSTKYGYNNLTSSTYPRPGFRINKITYHNSIVWEPKSPNCYCHFVNLYIDDNGFDSCYLLISEGKDRRVEYYINSDNGWLLVEKKKFYNSLAKKENEPRYSHINDGLDENGNRTIETSYFTNKQGLMVRTYRSLVPKHKGVLLVSHGLRAHYMSTLLKFNIDWNYYNFGFQTHPYIICPDANMFYNLSHLNVDRYRHIFEYNFYDKTHSYNKLPFLEYSGSLLECLNNMGFSVYGMDLQSHGFSEGIDSIRSHVANYKDYFDDIIQYMNIIKRDKFLDRNQVYDESVWSDEIIFNDKFYLFGFSLSSNLFIRTIQEYYKSFDQTKLFLNGLISVSGMLDIKNDLRNLIQRIIYIFLFPMFSLIKPRKRNSCQHFLDYGSTYEFTVFLNDALYSPHRFSWRTLDTLFKSCDNIIKYRKYYPKNLPTLLIHSTEDPGCSIRGVRKVVSKMVDYNIESREIKGNYHHTYKTSCLYHIVTNFGEWLDKIEKKD